MDLDTVACWYDKSGNLNHATANGNPTYTSSSLNIKNGISFTADNYEINDSDTLDMQLENYTIYLIYNTTSSSKMGLVAKRGAVADSNGYHGYLIYQESGTVNSMYCTSYDNTEETTISSTLTYDDGSVHLINYEAEREQDLSLSIDSLLDGTPASIGLSSETYIENASNLIIGGRSTSAASTLNDFTGNIGEVLIYKKKLSAEEKTNITTYLAVKWGI